MTIRNYLNTTTLMRYQYYTKVMNYQLQMYPKNKEANDSTVKFYYIAGNKQRNIIFS